MRAFGIQPLAFNGVNIWIKHQKKQHLFDPSSVRPLHTRMSCITSTPSPHSMLPFFLPCLHSYSYPEMPSRHISPCPPSGVVERDVPERNHLTRRVCCSGLEEEEGLHRFACPERTADAADVVSCQMHQTSRFDTALLRLSSSAQLIATEAIQYLIQTPPSMPMSMLMPGSISSWSSSLGKQPRDRLSPSRFSLQHASSVLIACPVI
ncbi:hypothetical protein FSOLCH5_002968 [Fusarium solani]|jgi:hypothetical protein